ncbi:MAG TPA: hypothetical protein VNZ93_17830 [Pseudorhodoplanes sp.]|nr:hypothetical protein [Pseudorhodoplanes sp.]
MKLRLDSAELADLVCKQLRSTFQLSGDEERLIVELLPGVLARVVHCFERTPNKYYRDDELVKFSPFHSGQYAIFLYFLSRALSLGRQADLADRVYFLNKMLNAVDIYHEVELPSVFFVDHPVGTVLGRARYGEYFSFSQQNTVGNNKSIYPVIGKNVQMMAGAMILGRCRIGDNVIVSAGCIILDQDVPECAIVFGRSPDLTIVRKDASYFSLDGR